MSTITFSSRPWFSRFVWRLRIKKARLCHKAKRLVTLLHQEIFCTHEWVLDVAGGYHFDGEVWDDIKEAWFCRKCGKVLPDEIVYLDDDDVMRLLAAAPAEWTEEEAREIWADIEMGHLKDEECLKRGECLEAWL